MAYYQTKGLTLTRRDMGEATDCLISTRAITAK